MAHSRQHFSATLASVNYELSNGYDYLWRVLELTVPGFDPRVPIQAPIWSDVEDIFHFAQAFLLFFRLQAKEFDDGYLPPHLRPHGLATSIHQNAQARLWDIISPRV